MGVYQEMMSDQLKAYATEMAEEAIRRIEGDWTLVSRYPPPRSPQGAYEADKRDWRHAIRYAVAKAAFEAVAKLEPDTSDIPEVGEEWFHKAKLIQPEKE
jgi:hypothetical protein